MNVSSNHITFGQLGEYPESGTISINTLRKARVCFVAHFAYGALSGGNSGFIGGIERQMSLMAKWLSKRGYKISMLTCDEGQQDGEEIDGVRIFKMCHKEAGVKGVRFFWPKWTSLVAAMKRATALSETALQRLPSVWSEVYLFCRE